jgi:hypothetical protein
VVALGGLVLAYLGYRWLRAQIPRRQPAGDLELGDEEQPDWLVLESGALARALESDLAAERGIGSASAQIVAGPPSPELRLRVEVSDRLDVPDLRRRLEDHVLPRLCRALEVEHVRAHVRVDLVGAGSRELR